MILLRSFTQAGRAETSSLVSRSSDGSLRLLRDWVTMLQGTLCDRILSAGASTRVCSAWLLLAQLPLFSRKSCCARTVCQNIASCGTVRTVVRISHHSDQC